MKSKTIYIIIGVTLLLGATLFFVVLPARKTNLIKQIIAKYPIHFTGYKSDEAINSLQHMTMFELQMYLEGKGT